MRTTLSIDETLLREAKSIAAKSGETLSGFVESALREKLNPQRSSARHNRRPMLFFPHEPGMVVNVDLNSNAQVLDLLDELDEIDRRERADQRLAP
jgi:hypothetical protein